MRTHRLAKNTASSLVYQITAILCGFVLPRAILKAYGSVVNGLVSSISQFIQVVTFLDMGVSAVVKASLYEPLAKKDNRRISEVVASADRFFHRIATIIAIYIGALVFIYPLIIDHGFSFFFTASLILVMGISTFSQYYFGIVNGVLLSADQRGYIQFITKTITIVVNTLACVALIHFGAGIHTVKLASAGIFLVQPFVLYYYVKKDYQLDRKIKYTGEPIKQKWNGLAQHIAAVVLDGTDTIVLTMFSTLSNVSIYSVYYLVVHGVTQLVISLTGGLQSLMGELWAKQELPEMNKAFGWAEWSIHTVTVFVFGCTGMLILPFVRVYTKGITDVYYSAPLFGALLTAANAGHCLRLPYNLVTLACGHFKQTQRNYIIAAFLNIIVSVATVKTWGLIGVAVGTLAAMFYQTTWLAIYTTKHLIKWPLRKWAKQFFTDFVTVFAASFSSAWVQIKTLSYGAWAVMAIKVAFIWLVVVLIINRFLYTEYINTCIRKCRSLLFGSP